ncbi:MAG TPA: nuclear transport factor 2 family protein [Burkholderiaceae bacterium]|nr:nuclear transport factor 2 family protein [Burkholderiaceae bacterium]
MSKESTLAQIGAVEATVPRDRIVHAIQAFLASYPARGEADIQARAELFADDAVFEDPVGAKPLVGKQALVDFFRAAFAAGWVIRMKSDRIVVCGNEAVSLTQGEWGLPGTEPAKVFIVHTFAFNAEGKATRLRVFFDQNTIE